MFLEIAFCVQEEEMLKRYIVHKKVIFALWKFCKVIKPFQYIEKGNLNVKRMRGEYFMSVIETK